MAADARLVLPDMRSLEAKATEVVSVTLDAPLLGLAARFLDDSKPEDAAAKELVAGLKGVYVRASSSIRTSPTRRRTSMQFANSSRHPAGSRSWKCAASRREPIRTSTFPWTASAPRPRDHRERTARAHHREHRGVDRPAEVASARRPVRRPQLATGGQAVDVRGDRDPTSRIQRGVRLPSPASPQRARRCVCAL